MGDRRGSSRAPLSRSPLGSASRIYFCVIVWLGLAILGFSIYQILGHSVSHHWLILACLTAVSGGFTVPIPGVRSKISVAESFIFTNVILFGPAVGSVTAALDGFLGFLRTGSNPRRLEYAAFNMASMGLSVYLAGTVFFAVLDGAPLHESSAMTLRDLIFPAMVMALVHYLTNTASVALIIALETGRNTYRVWRDRFLWTSVTYFAGASVASLVAANVQWLAPALLGIAFPIIFVTYLAFRSYLDKARESEHRRALDCTYMRTVEALSAAIDAREAGTLGQARRVQVYARGLARAAGITDEKELRGIETGALLLDIGNLAVPESILNNPGELTNAEFQKVMTHPVVGADILSTINFPYPVADYVRHHHERWDGSGYPDGLQGTQIPLGARILAVADCFVALTCDRPYQRGRSMGKALQDICSWAGTRYDPALVEKFVGICEALTADAQAMNPSQAGHETKASVSDRGVSGGEFPAKILGDLAAYHDISSTQREMSILRELSLKLGSTLNLCETLSVIAAETARLVPFTTFVVYLRSDEDRRIAAIHISGANTESFQGHGLDWGQGISGRVAARREAAINAEAALDLPGIPAELQKPLEIALVHPLIFEGECVGTISLYRSRANRFKDDHLRILATICHRAASAIQNARRYGEAQGEAAADPLTNLPNIRFLRRQFAQEIAKSKEFGHPLSILGMDLDGFKSVNDNFGHQAGDRVLVEVARVLRNVLREADLLVRHGGDEFIATLPQTDSAGASELAERIQREIDGHRFELSPGNTVGVGISIGWASYPEDGNTLEGLLRAADGEMYRDKKRRADLVMPLSAS